MPVPEDLKALPLSDMILRAIVEPGAFVGRDRYENRRLEPMNAWRARAVWEAMQECGIDATREFLSLGAMEAFDRAATGTMDSCPVCNSTDPGERKVIGTLSSFRCDDDAGWHKVRLAACEPTDEEFADAGRRWNDMNERDRRICTDISALWCPLHGDCKCPTEDPSSALDAPIDGAECPLHRPGSEHGQQTTRLAASNA